MRISTTLMSGSYAGFWSSTNKTLNPYDFAYGVQMRHMLLPWNLFQLLSEMHLQAYQ